MSAKPNEGNLEDAGEPGANSNSSASQSQPLEASFTELMATLQKKVDAQDGEIKALKSGKDKAVDRAIKSQEETLAKLAKYLNVDETQVREAQRQSVLDDLVAERVGRNQPDQPIGGTVGSGGNAAEQSIDVESTLKAMQFEDNDVALAALKVLHGNNQAGLLKAAANLRISQLAQKPAGPAGALPPTGGQGGSHTVENPIQNITESRDLYKLAAKEFKKTPRA